MLQGGDQGPQNEVYFRPSGRGQSILTRDGQHLEVSDIVEREIYKLFAPQTGEEVQSSEFNPGDTSEPGIIPVPRKRKEKSARINKNPAPRTIDVFKGHER